MNTLKYWSGAALPRYGTELNPVKFFTMLPPSPPSLPPAVGSVSRPARLMRTVRPPPGLRTTNVNYFPPFINQHSRLTPGLK